MKREETDVTEICNGTWLQSELMNETAHSFVESELTAALERAHLALSRIAKQANDLAKQLPGREARRCAYAIKNVCISELVRSRAGMVNDVRPDGVVGLDLPGRRLHTKPSELESDVRRTVRCQAQFVPTVAPLSERLSSDQFEALRNFVSNPRSAA